MQRRRFIHGLTATGLLLAAAEPLLAAAMSHEGIAPALATPGFNPDLEIELVAATGEAAMLPGSPTRVWRYNGRVMAGDSAALDFLDGSGHIPVIRVRRGQKLRIHFRNQLSEPSIVHWHGLHMVQRMDGHPMYAIEAGETFVYEFVIDNRAGTYWFHPHPHLRTSFQVYQGMTGMLLVSDDEEDAVGLPQGERDVPLVIQDRSFDRENQLVYLGNMRHNWMMGFSGERVLVNGIADYQRTVPRTAHRLRIFNGSNATLYHLRWSNGAPFIVIGSDGGLLERAQNQQALTLGIGERVDVWIDFSALAAGSSIELLAESYSPSLQHFTEQQIGADLVGGARPIARFVAAQGDASPQPVPGELSRFPQLRAADAVNANSPRTIQIAMRQGQAMLNGRVFGAMDEVHASDRVKAGTAEIWEFVNDARMGMGMGMGGMMQMAHPMHIHNVQFKLLSRSRDGEQSALHQRLSSGFTDAGLKDVVLVLPGERVRVLMQFEQHTGIYLYHCHILEHEDLGMMRNFLIEA